MPVRTVVSQCKIIFFAESSVKCAPKHFGWGYMPVRTVVSQCKIKFFAELFCMRRVVLFTAFFALLHSIACFGSVFFRFKPIRQPRQAHSPR